MSINTILNNSSKKNQHNRTNRVTRRSSMRILIYSCFNWDT